tara:strand:+ start:336 stop:1019 length:684 start_codon:yes stop_codon:yes gene_type:complete
LNDQLNENIIFGSTEISNGSFIFSIVLSFALSYILSKVYKSQSRTLSNPESLARIFPLLSIATTIIITVVKSSLALSLGLVGALSIVRFRTAIKEPEELTYIFLCIGIGLATGANQFSAAIIGLILTIFFAYFYNFSLDKKKYQNLIRVSINGISSAEIGPLVEILKRFSIKINFKNMSISNSENDYSSTVAFSIIPNNFEDLNRITNLINKEFPSATINYVENNIN